MEGRIGTGVYQATLDQFHSPQMCHIQIYTSVGSLRTPAIVCHFYSNGF